MNDLIMYQGLICHGCGHIKGEPLRKNSNGEDYLACCPDSNYQAQSLLIVSERYFALLNNTFNL